MERGADGVVQLQHGDKLAETHELQQYDRSGKLTARAVYQNQRSHEDSPLVAWCSSYRYSLEGDLLEVRDTQRGRRLFEVDAAHRLAAEVGSDGQRIDYLLDEAGNLLSKPGLVLTKLTTGNRLLHADAETFTYDERDNIALRVRGIDHPAAPRVRYERDSFDQLIEIHDGQPEPWTASYDGLGRRISSGRGDRQTLFWWEDDRLAAETFPDGKFRIYIYAHERALVPIGFVDYASVDAAPESGRAYSVYSDQVGLPLCIADSEGRVVWWAEHVDPYGAIHIRPGALVEYNLRWPGHYFDADTGLHYNRFRYYDPRLGRYLESDPLGCAGGVNLYAYSSNPLVKVDVLGLVDHNEKSDPPKDKGTGKPGDEDTDDGAPPKPKPVETPEEKKARLDEKRKKMAEETAAREEARKEADRKAKEEQAERDRRRNEVAKQAEDQSLEDARNDPNRDTSREPVVGENNLRNHMGRPQDSPAPEYGYHRDDGTFVMVEVKNQKHPDSGHAVEKFKSMSESGAEPQQEYVLEIPDSAGTFNPQNHHEVNGQLHDQDGPVLVDGKPIRIVRKPFPQAE